MFNHLEADISNLREAH